MAVVVFASIIYNLPRFFERRVTVILCHGVSVPITVRTLHNNRHYLLFYKTLCYFVFRSVGPLVALIVLNAELIRALRAVRRRRRRLLVQKKPKSRGADAGGENLTLMLVTVVTVFIVCQLPNVGVRIVYTAGEFAPTGWLDLESLRYGNVACNALLTLNSAVNFAVYCLVGKKFRRIFLHEVATCGRRRPSSGADDGESATIRQGSPATNGPGRCPLEDLDATQLTDLGPQRFSGLCGGRVHSAVGRRRQQ